MRSGLAVVVFATAVVACAAPRPADTPPAESVAVSPAPVVDARPAPQTEPAPPAAPSAPSSTTPPAVATMTGEDPAHCGIGPGESTAAPPSWPGESAHCRDLDLHWAAVRFDERACKQDADCAIVVGRCEADAVTKKALPKYREPRCEQPTPRTCARPLSRAACVSGCCRAPR